jgi:hypothetical protein
LQALAAKVSSWFTGGVKRDGGAGNFAKNNAIGAAKGTGTFLANTVKAASAAGQLVSGNPVGAMQTMMAPSPQSLQPSNQTQAQASTATPVALTVATAAVGGEASAAGASSGAAAEVETGTQLFRVFGGDATPFGNPAGGFFTTVDPATVADFRTAAGLPDGNTGQFVLSGTLTDTTGATTGTAAPGPGGVGGTLPEVIVPDAASKITVTKVSGANPPI